MNNWKFFLFLLLMGGLMVGGGYLLLNSGGGDTGSPDDPGVNRSGNEQHRRSEDSSSHQPQSHSKSREENRDSSGGVVLTGKVINYLTEEPVRGEEVRVLHEGGIAGTAKLDETGSFRMSLRQENNFDILIQHPAYLPLDRILSLSGRETNRTIRVIPSASIAGRVLDPDGTPIANMEVSVRLDQDSRHLVQFRDKRLFPESYKKAIRLSLSPGSYGQKRTRTDEEGRFHISNLLPTVSSPLENGEKPRYILTGNTE